MTLKEASGTLDRTVRRAGGVGYVKVPKRKRSVRFLYTRSHVDIPIWKPVQSYWGHA